MFASSRKRSDDQVNRNPDRGDESVKRQLEALAASRGLEKPVYTTTQYREKRGPAVWMSKLTLSGQSFHSHPATTYTQEDAEAAAAVKALESLRKNTAVALAPGSSAQAAADKALVLQILEIVAESPAGMLDQGVKDEYVKRFAKSLPGNWIDVLKQDQRLNVETVKTFNKELTTISVSKPNLSSAGSSVNGNSSAPSAHNGVELIPDLPPVLIEEEQEDDIFSPNQNPIPVANVPPADKWADFYDVHVTLVVDPSTFWIQSYASTQPGSDYSHLKLNMAHFYCDPENVEIPLSFDVIHVNTLLAGRQRDSQTGAVAWHRVKVLNINQPDLFVQLIDEGRCETFSLKDLQPLFTQFRSLPQQAMRACLAGVRPIGSKAGDEVFKWSESTKNTFKKLIGNKAFVTTIVKETFPPGDKRDPCVHLTMYDTSTEDDVNIADAMIDTREAERA